MIGNDIYDPEVCKQKLEEKGLTPCLRYPVLAPHCTDIIQVLCQFCEKGGLEMYHPYHTCACVRVEGGVVKEYRYFSDVEIFDKCTELGGPWEIVFCDCCCMGSSGGALVETSAGRRSIELLVMGEQVLAAAPRESSGDLSWRSVLVTFSEGVGDTSQTMVSLVYGPQEGSGGGLACSADLVVMLHGGRLVRASQLRYGDFLTDKDGGLVEIRRISIGGFTGGVHHLGVSAADDLEPSI